VTVVLFKYQVTLVNMFSCLCLVSCGNKSLKSVVEIYSLTSPR